MAESVTKKLNPGYWVPTLYFAEGLPFVVINVVSVLMYKALKVSDSQITLFTTLIILPWTLKPIWGPLLEMFKTKKYFVVATEFIAGVTFGLLMLTLHLQSFFGLSLALFAIIAFNGATHDIAADGVYINALSESEQSKYVGWQGAFYNVAKVLSQGAFVFLAGMLEKSLGVVTAWTMVMGLFGVVLILLSLYHSRFLPVGGATEAVKSTKEAFATFWDVMRTFFEKKFIAWGIAFIILYRFAEGQAMKIVPLFMKADRSVGGLGLETAQIGIIYGIFPPVAFIAGSLLAGYFVAKRSLKQSLFVLCCFFNIPFAVYAFLAYALPTNFYVISVAVIFEYFGYGFGFVGLTLYMMQQIAPGKYKMAHYAFATGIMNLGMMIPSALSGFISDAVGYRNFFLWVMIATIPSFLVAWFVPFRDTAKDESAKTV
jgi:PAT family beta-lactamase induction signal transducer AmpG